MRLQTRQPDHSTTSAAGNRTSFFNDFTGAGFFSKESGNTKTNANTGIPFFSTAGGDIETFNRKTRSRGKPLALETKQTMERGFSADFSGIRIHDDEKAASLADGLQADAFTAGQHIYFDTKTYKPGTTEGKKLLAHELTHSLQGVNHIARQTRSRAPRPSNHCGQTNNVSSLQHLIIQLWYQTWQAPLLREYEMPADMRPGRRYSYPGEGGWADHEEMTASDVERVMSGSYTVYLADLVDPGTHEMWEIMHPSDGASQKRSQLNGYIARANLHCGTPAFQPGERLGIQYIPNPQRPLLIVTPILGGLLQYRYGPEMERVPAVRRDIILERLLQSIRGQYSFVMPEELLNPAPVTPGVPVPAGSRAADPQAAEASRRALAVVAGVAVTGAGAAIIRRAAWRHFWRVVARRFAARGALAAFLSALDGPAPAGELLSAGMALVTIGEIISNWNSLWQSAEVEAQNGT